MKLIKLNEEFYLINDDVSKMAKDLPEGTLVFCLDETHMNDPAECIRKSAKGDNCYGCQPLIASTKKIEGTSLLDKPQIDTLLNKNVDVMSNKWALDNADETMGTNSALNRGFKGGFDACEKLNSDKKFTIEEAEIIFKEGFNLCLSNNWGLLKGRIHPDIVPFKTESMDFDDCIKYFSQKQKQWEVEVEMGKVLFDPNRPVPYYSGEPAITGGYINVTRIIA